MRQVEISSCRLGSISAGQAGKIFGGHLVETRCGQNLLWSLGQISHGRSVEISHGRSVEISHGRSVEIPLGRSVEISCGHPVEFFVVAQSKFPWSLGRNFPIGKFPVSASSSVI